MLPTPSWLRFRKSRGQQQTNKQHAHRAEQREFEQQEQLRRPPELPDQEKQQNEEHAEEANQEQHQQQEQEPIGQRRPLAAAPDAGDDDEQPAQQQVAARGKAQTQTGRRERGGGRNLPNVRRALASLIQRALSPIASSSRHAEPGVCAAAKSQQTATSRKAGGSREPRSPLRKLKRGQPSKEQAQARAAFLASNTSKPSGAKKVAGAGQYQPFGQEQADQEQQEPSSSTSGDVGGRFGMVGPQQEQFAEQQCQSQQLGGGQSATDEPRAGEDSQRPADVANRVVGPPKLPARPATKGSRGIPSGGGGGSRSSQALAAAGEPDVCHLTARTSDNQCALHRGHSPPSSMAAPSQQQSPLINAGEPGGVGQVSRAAEPARLEPSKTWADASQEEARHAPVTLAASPLGAVVGAGDSLLSGQQLDKAKPSPILAGQAAESCQLAPAASKAKTKGSNSSTRERKGRLARRERGEHDVASWPLARPTLGANSAFGDAEDISGPWRAGRLFLCGATMDGDHAAAAAECGAHAQPSNYSHRRPFAQSFERPTTGWLYNATGPHKINLPRATAASLKANFLAVGGFRRASYDDRAGDKDISIILQPSDLDDIEKRAAAGNNGVSYGQAGHDQAAVVAALMVSGNSISNSSYKVYKTKAANGNGNNLRYQFKTTRHKTTSSLLRRPAPTVTAETVTRRQQDSNSSSTPLIGADSLSSSPAEAAAATTTTSVASRLKPPNSSPSASSSSSPETTLGDLKLAKSLLDQDYNRTVRLFISKSALNWNFNSFTFDALCCGRSLTELLLHLFDYYNLFKIFNLNIVNVLKCFRLLEFGYHSTNPYHNSIHAADVTQAMHCFIQENKIREHMTHLETLCSILAAVCHDLDHPGVNQSFLVATNNPLASLYNNNSVLENHHWRFALCIFKEAQLFDHFQEDVMTEMKSQLKHLILATDIARQNDYLKRFRELTSSRKFSMQNTDDRALVLQMALKCADLGNPCRPWLISRVWSNLICDEFYKMGTIERRLGIPLTPICQREKTSIAGIQTDFFRFIVLPLLELWHKFLESPLSSLLMSNFEHNYQRWQRANWIVQQLRRRKSVACLSRIEASSASSKWPAIPPPASGGGCDDGGRRQAGANSGHSGRKGAQGEGCSGGGCSSGEEAGNCGDGGHCSSGDGSEGCCDGPGGAGCQPRSEARPATTQSIKNSRINPLAMSGYRKTLSPIEDGDAPSPDQQQQQLQDCHTFLSCGQIGPNKTTVALAPTTSGKSSAFPPNPQSSASSSSAASSSVSQASSACSSPVIQRSMSSKTSIDQLVGGHSALHLQQHRHHHHHQQQPQHHIKPQSKRSTQLQHHHHPKQHSFLGQYYEPSGGPKIRPPPTSNLGPVRQSTPSSAASRSKSLYNGKRRESDPGCCADKYELAAAIVLIQYQNNSFFHQRRSSLPVCVPKRRSSK